MTSTTKTWSLVLALALIAAPALAVEKKSKKSDVSAGAGGGMDPEMMKKWQVYSTPAENHKALEPLVGSFAHTSKFWMSADAPPQVSTGTTEAKWILGQRFVESTVAGQAMGQPFEGRSIIGYDNEKKQYTSVWLDSMATGIMMSTGTYSAAGKKLTEYGTASCPFEHSKSFRGVTTLTDSDSHTYEMYGSGPDGKEFKMMEITYRRKK